MILRSQLAIQLARQDPKLILAVLQAKIAEEKAQVELSKIAARAQRDAENAARKDSRLDFYPPPSNSQLQSNPQDSACFFLMKQKF